MIRTRTILTLAATLTGLALCLGADFLSWEVKPTQVVDIHMQNVITRHVNGIGQTLYTETDTYPTHSFRTVAGPRNGFTVDPAGLVVRLFLLVLVGLTLLLPRGRGLALLAGGIVLVLVGPAGRMSTIEPPGLFAAGAVLVVLAGAADLLLGLLFRGRAPMQPAEEFVVLAVPAAEAV